MSGSRGGVRAGRETRLPGLNLDLCGGGRGGRFRPIKSTSKRGGEKITPQRPLFVAAHYTALRSIPLSVRADDFIFAEFCNRSSVMGCKWLRGETHARDCGSARPDDSAAISCNRRGFPAYQTSENLTTSHPQRCPDETCHSEIFQFDSSPMTCAPGKGCCASDLITWSHFPA